MNKKNNSFKKQTTMIFTIMICMIVLLLVAMVSSNQLLVKGTYGACSWDPDAQETICEGGAAEGGMTAGDMSAVSPGNADKVAGDIGGSVHKYSDDSFSIETSSSIYNYNSDGELTASAGKNNKGSVDSITPVTGKSNLPTLTTSYYSEDGSYTKSYSYKNGSSVKKNYNNKDTLLSTVTTGTDGTVNISVEDKTPNSESGLIDASHVTYYQTEADCKAAGITNCRKIGDMYVDSERAADVLWYRSKDYCESITGLSCAEKCYNDACKIKVYSACDCDDGCVGEPGDDQGTGCDSVGSPCEINGGQGTIVESNGNCVCQGSGSPTPGTGDTPTNYCISNCEPSDPDTPIYVEPGVVIYPKQSCWMCAATDGSGNKYVKANSFADAANATAGYACKVVESTKCNNAPVVDSKATYCWSCIRNFTKIYARANLESVARSITGGDSCTIVGIEENDPLCLPPTETTTNHCWSCTVSGKAKYAIAATSSAAASKTGGSSCTIVSTAACDTTPTPTPTNVTENPKTGTFAIIIAWLVGLIAIVYAGWYFKKSSKIKND